MFNTVDTAVIWNPSAASASDADDVRRALSNIRTVRLCESIGREDAIEKTANAIHQGADLVVAAGGDGTVNSVLEGVRRIDADTALGILPLGTGNDLARALKIPLSPLHALEALAAGRTAPLDVLAVETSTEQRAVANMLTGGNTGRYLDQMTEDAKKRWGPFSYLRGIIDVVRDLEVYPLELICDDGPAEHFNALNVFVANGCYSGGGLEVSPQAVLDDGFVDVVIVLDGDPGEIVSLTTAYVLSDYLEHELIAFRKARSLKITSPRPLPLTADGDAIGTAPLSVTVNERCLRVLLPGPASFAD